MSEVIEIPIPAYPPTMPVIATLTWATGYDWAALTYRPPDGDPRFVGLIHLGAEFLLRQISIPIAARDLPRGVHQLAFDAAIPLDNSTHSAGVRR